MTSARGAIQAVRNSSLGTPILGVVVAIAISWGLTCVFERIPVPGVTLIATAGIAVVLVHTLPLVLLKDRVHSGLVLFATVMAASWGLALVLRVTPLSRIALGVGRPRRDRSAVSAH